MRSDGTKAAARMHRAARATISERSTTSDRSMSRSGFRCDRRTSAENGRGKRSGRGNRRSSSYRTRRCLLPRVHLLRARKPPRGERLPYPPRRATFVPLGGIVGPSHITSQPIGPSSRANSRPASTRFFFAPISIPTAPNSTNHNRNPIMSDTPEGHILRDCFYCGNAQPGPHKPDCAIVRSSEAGAVRSFETGATRSSEAGRYDPEGFLSPIAIERYCEYMAAHQRQPDGSIRASDNWQKGLSVGTYMKGMWRHFLHLWTRHRGHKVRDANAAANEIEDLCALLFNVQGMLHELLKQEGER